MNLTVYDKEDALLAYVDLLGTTELYKNEKVPLKDVAKILYSSLLDKFCEDFQNRFEPREIKDHFYVNVYSDSIMICQRKKTTNVVDRLTEVLLRFQANCLFNLGNSIRIKNRDYELPVPSRILIGTGKYFSLALKAYRDQSILGSKYSSVSLCGGHGLLSSDEKLKGLPIGVYVQKDLLKDSRIKLHRRIKTSSDLYFIKQETAYIDFLLMYPEQKTLREFVIDVIERSLITDEKAIRKWDLWLSAHEGKLDFIQSDRALDIVPL